MCLHCGQDLEIVRHLLIQYMFVICYSYLELVKLCAKFQSFMLLEPLALLKSCEKAGSSQLKDVDIVVVINTTWFIWISRNHARFCTGPFSQAELTRDMVVIEIAFEPGWRHLWLECDSTLVTLVFSNFDIFPWQLQNWWFKCIALSKFMHYICISY